MDLFKLFAIRKCGFYSGKRRCIVCGRKHSMSFPNDFPDKFKMCCYCRNDIEEFIFFHKNVKDAEKILKNNLSKYKRILILCDTREQRKCYEFQIGRLDCFVKLIHKLFELFELGN